MSWLRRSLLALLILGPIWAQIAYAHTLSESYSSWQINGNTVRLQFTVPDLEARRLSDSGKQQPTVEQLDSYLADRVGVTTGDQRCPRTQGPLALSTIAGFRRIEFVFTCPTMSDIKLHSAAFYDRVPSHTNFARILDRDGNLVEQLLTSDHREVDVSGRASQSVLESAGLLQYIRMGIMHIFTGVDHMSFMLGLVLISRRVRDLLFVITGFTLGHSLTLGLAVTGILRPNPQYIDALVALTISLIGAEIIGDSTHRPVPIALSMGGLLLWPRGHSAGYAAGGWSSVFCQLSDAHRTYERRWSCAPGHDIGLRPDSWLWICVKSIGNATPASPPGRAAAGFQSWRGGRSTGCGTERIASGLWPDARAACDTETAV